MGTGSYGGGGGGGGSGVGVGRSGGEYHSQGGTLVRGTVSSGGMARHFREALSAIPKEYLSKYISSPLAGAIYRELFLLNVDLVTNHSWTGIQQRLGVKGGAGCLGGIAHTLMARYGSMERDKRVQDTMSLAVEDFLTRAVGDDPDILLSGSSTDVLNAVDSRVFASTAGFFLSFVIQHMLEREHERLGPEGKAQLRSLAEAQANRIWARFDRDYRGKPFGNIPQVSAANLLHVISEEGWFAEEIKK